MMPDDIDPHTAEDRIIRARLTMLQAFGHMMHEAFDAMLHHSVNYRDIPEYRDQTLLEEASKVPLTRGVDKYLAWIGKVTNGIRAAVRRKSFRKV